MRHSLEWLLKVALNKPTIQLYARTDGWHVHGNRQCQMLVGDQFKILKYKEITPDEAKERKLTPYTCLENIIGNRRNKQ